DVERHLAAVLRGGIRIVQYRSKTGVDRDVVRRLHRRTSCADALLIVNDDLDAALESDGLHVGQEDLAVIDPSFRARLAGRVLGISCGLPDEVPAARVHGADYIGAGPFAATSSKSDAGSAIGSRGVTSVVRAAQTLPVAAIGGIGLDNLGAV